MNESSIHRQKKKKKKKKSRKKIRTKQNNLYTVVELRNNSFSWLKLMIIVQYEAYDKRKEKL